MSLVDEKMNILLSLGRNSIVKMTANTARWSIAPYRLEMDVNFPPELWELKKQDTTYDWKKSPAISQEVKDMITALETEYNEAIAVKFGAPVENEEEIHVESFLEPELPDDEKPSSITMSDLEIIRILDETIKRKGPTDTTYGVIIS